MDIDEFIYSKFLNYFKKKKRTSKELTNKLVSLEDIKSRLTIIARAITGNPIDIYPAEREGGYKNNSFFLPISFSYFPTQEKNISYYFFRILYLASQQKLNINLIETENKMTEYSSKILENIFVEYPISQDFHDYFAEYILENTKDNSLPDYSWLYGKLMKNEIEISEIRNANKFEEFQKEKVENNPTTTIKARAVEEIKSIEVDKKQQEDYVLTHNFEKVETADEFSGSWRDVDGDDELEKHQDALDEINMRLTVRVDDPTHSIYQADFCENTTISESAEIDNKGYHIRYDEWNYTKRIYKEKFCKVYPHTQLKTDSPYYHKTISQNASILNGLRKMLTNVNNKMQEQRRQSQGDEFDIDATTDMLVDIHSRHTPSENIYISKQKKEKDLSILVLLDISLSSDGYANGTKIIEVEKDVSILFGEILNEFNIDFSINAFYSKTRNYSSYLTLKEFDEKWSVAKHKIGAIEPTGYTRIGAAIRHSGALLDKRQTKNKWIILISDGKPNDYDRYEGKYGINDTKQALRELNNRNINAYALAIEAQAKFYLPLMFGQNHYQILTNTTELLKSLVKLYEKIKYQT